MKVCILGRGRLGRSLATSLRGRSATVYAELRAASSLASSRRTIEADLVLLAVPDGAIEKMSQSLAARLSPPASVIHCAGSKDASALEPLRQRGFSTGVLHPLVSLAGRRTDLEGAFWFFSGDAETKRRAAKLVSALHGTFVNAKVHGSTYHAAAALAANGSAALALGACDMLTELGIARRDAERAMGRLLVSVGQNISELGVAGVTGPIVRGDATTVEGHLQALARKSPKAREAYLAVAPLLLTIAKEMGTEAQNLRAIETLISEARQSRRRR